MVRCESKVIRAYCHRPLLLLDVVNDVVFWNKDQASRKKYYRKFAIYLSLVVYGYGYLKTIWFQWKYTKTNHKPTLLNEKNKKKVIRNIFSTHIWMILCMLQSIQSAIFLLLVTSTKLFKRRKHEFSLKTFQFLYWLTLIRISFFIVYLNYIAFAHFYHLENR